MIWDNVQGMLWTIAQGLLVIALPILAKFTIDWVREHVKLLRAKLSTEQNARIDAVIRMAVIAAEQLGITEAFSSETKKEKAILVVQKWLCDNDIYLDVHELSDRIEAAVYGEFNVPDRWDDPLEVARIAANIAALAYLGSGTHTEVLKAMALFVDKYLAQFGISVDIELIDGLIRAELAKLESETGKG